MIAYVPKENELAYDVATCDNEKIKEVAKALSEAGFYHSAKKYFVNANGSTPYFVIAKPYTKEEENEPDTMNMWIDVTHEYTVTAQYYYHTHFDKAEDAVKMVADFYNEVLAEYIVITPTHTIAFAHEAKGNWEDALRILADNDELVASAFHQMAPAIPPQSHHGHTYRYGEGLPLNDIVVAKENNQPLAGQDVYRVSVIFGKQAEYYFQS